MAGATATKEKPVADLAWAAAAARNLRLDAPRRLKSGAWVAGASAAPVDGDLVTYQGKGEDADAAYQDLLDNLPPLPEPGAHHCPTCTCEV